MGWQKNRPFFVAGSLVLCLQRKANDLLVKLAKKLPEFEVEFETVSPEEYLRLHSNSQWCSPLETYS